MPRPALRALRWAALPGFFGNKQLEVWGKHAIPERFVHSKCILAIWSITSYKFKVELIMETSMGFLPCFSPNPKPKPQSCQSCPVPLAQFIIYHSTRKKPPGTPVDLRTSLVAPEAHELRGLRGSWGIFSMSQILRRIRPPDHVFQKVQMEGVHFQQPRDPFSSIFHLHDYGRESKKQLYQVTTSDGTSLPVIYRGKVFERTFVFLASPQNLLGLTNLLG